MALIAVLALAACDGGANHAPTAEDLASTLWVRVGSTLTVTADTAVKDAPNESALTLATIPRGTVVVAFESASVAGYLHVRAGRLSGWVLNSALQVRGTLDEHGNGTEPSADAGQSVDSGTGAPPRQPVEHVQWIPPVINVPCNRVVSNGGKDTNPGHLQAPFRTLQRALDVAQPGDVVCARAGTYAGAFFRNSGTASRPITLKNFPGERVIVEGSGLTLFYTWGVEVAYQVVEGLEIRGEEQSIYLHSARDVVIRGNFLHSSSNGIFGSGANVRIEGNFISDNSNTGITATGTAFTIVNNVIHSNAGSAIVLNGTPFNPNDSNRPAGVKYAGASDWLISNNTLAFNANGIVVSKPLASASEIQNNIFYRNAVGVDFTGGGGHALRKNVFSGNTYLDIRGSSASYSELGHLSGEPDFANPTAFNFRLRAGSLAIDTGEANRAPAHDFDGVSRPQGGGVDIGAFER